MSCRHAAVVGAAQQQRALPRQALLPQRQQPTPGCAPESARHSVTTPNNHLVFVQNKAQDSTLLNITVHHGVLNSQESILVFHDTAAAASVILSTIPLDGPHSPTVCRRG
jgi:hypothetical protein